MLKDMPIIVAHRGHAAHWPENTLPALDAAVAAGARWVEVDVQLCADGVPVLLHDAHLTRVAGREGSIFDLSSAELGDISVGEPARLGARFPEARAPTLAAFADWLAAHPKVTAFVEFKVESIERFGRETVLAACISAMAPARGRWAPISFDHEILALAGDAGFEDLGWVVRGFDAAVAERARALPARWLFCNQTRLPAGRLPRGPWDWVIYEVANASEAQSLMARGARWLETMAAASLREGLEAAPEADRGSGSGVS
jgi:glycerophosphoryl diester phosphodiesterase